MSPGRIVAAIVGFFAVLAFMNGAIAACIGLGAIAALFFLGSRSRVQAQSDVESMMHVSTREAITESLTYVSFEANGTVSVAVNSLSEAKAAIKELKLLKKSFALKRQEIANQQKSIRASHTDDMRRRGSKVRGGGGFGRFVRAMQTVSRDAARNQLATALQPLENRKQQVEHALVQIDSLITQVEAMTLSLD